MRFFRKPLRAYQLVSFATLSGLYGLTIPCAVASRVDHPSPPVRIELASSAASGLALPECATSSAFLRAIQPRLPTRTIEVADASDLGPALSAPVQVTVHQLPLVVEATLVVQFDSGETLTRRIEAGTCVEALDAIAFVTAVALDPEQGGAPVLSEKAPAAQPPARDGHLETTSVPDSTHCWSAWTRFGVVGGAAPSLLGGGGFGVKWGCRKSGLWSPSLALGGTFFLSPLIEETDGSALVYLFSVPFDLCPSRWGGEVFALVPCATLSSGALLAQGVNTLVPESHLRPWLSAGGSLSLEFRVYRQLALTARGSVETPLLRYSFVFGDDEFYSVSGISGRGTFGVLLKL